MTTDATIIALLTSIDASLKAILAARKAPKAEQPIQVDLDGPHGDPEVKAKDPKDWQGDSMRGKRFSECPSAYLLLVADRLDYFATKETDLKKKRYTELDAARARGWAERNKHKPAPTYKTDKGYGF